MTFIPRAKEDECIVRASDGLWDVMSNEEACDLARKRILFWHEKNSVNLPSEMDKGNEMDPAAQTALSVYQIKLSRREAKTTLP